MNSRAQCKLVLSTGHELSGTAIGAATSRSGELVFTTAMVGYPETLTDPSYHGQIVVFAYPLIGNYGVPKTPGGFDPLACPQFESYKIHAAGVVVSELSAHSHHWQSAQTLDTWLKESGVPGITGLDTRHLVQLIRSQRQLSGRIVANSDQPSLHNVASGGGPFYDPGAVNVLPEVSVKKTITFGRGRNRVALLDLGVKWSLVRKLVACDCEVTVVPWDYRLQDVDCSAWLLSNGPGDPTCTGDLIERCKWLLRGDIPVLGVCLGHQILALASGAKTTRLPYGHRSHNQPVLDVLTGRGYMSSQNHGYAVVEDSIPNDWQVWFRNLNDGSIEGIRHRSMPVRAVQFHPEAHCGPQEAAWIIEEFVDEVKNRAP